MKTSIPILFILLIFLSVTPPDKSLSVQNNSLIELPDRNLVAHYSFNDCTAADELGKSNGTRIGQPDCGCGVIGSAMYFDGVNDFVTFDGPVNEAFGDHDFTISFYFKTYANTTKQIFLSNRKECNLESPFVELKHLQPCGGSGSGRVWAEASESSGKRTVGVGLLPESRWKHVTMVRSGEDIVLFMNGEEVDRRKASRGVADLNGNGPLSIAYSPCINASLEETRARYFPLIGAMDELRVYNKALSSDQVKLLYDQAPVETAEVDCAS